MASPLIDLITSADPAIRNQSLDAVCARASAEELLAACAELESFRRRSDNLYERVRALFFLYAIHRFHLPGKLNAPADGMIPFKGFEHLLQHGLGLQTDLRYALRVTIWAFLRGRWLKL